MLSSVFPDKNPQSIRKTTERFTQALCSISMIFNAAFKRNICNTSVHRRTRTLKSQQKCFVHNQGKRKILSKLKKIKLENKLKLGSELIPTDFLLYGYHMLFLIHQKHDLFAESIPQRFVS